MSAKPRSMPKVTQKKLRTRVTKHAPVTREFTINLHKRLYGSAFKRRAPRAIRAIKKFALDNMGSRDVRIDTQLNGYIWSKGVKNVPYRVRVRLSRKKKEDDEVPKNDTYVVATLVPVTSFK